jgi:hypothetical protein
MQDAEAMTNKANGGKGEILFGVGVFVKQIIG